MRSVLRVLRERWARDRVRSDKLITVLLGLLEAVQIPLILKIPRQGENQVERFTEQMTEETI
jgi:hypothetical protein